MEVSKIMELKELFTLGLQKRGCWGKDDILELFVSCENKIIEEREDEG